MIPTSTELAGECNARNETRRDFLSLAAAGIATRASAAIPKPARPPNVIILITDDQGYGDLGCHGNPIIGTPNFDRLHAESVRLTNFHVDPTCAPTRSALMTGRYSHRTGVWHTIMSRSVLHRNEVTMADIFRQSGYRTGIFGKWHLGGNYPYRPIDRGFDQWVGLGDCGLATASDYWGNDRMNDTYWRNGRWEAVPGFCTDVYFHEATEFINRHRREPFFVYLATNVPHDPWNVPREWVGPYRDANLPTDLKYAYASVSRVDFNLGLLRRFLARHQLSENTIIVFLTDNGSAWGRRAFNAGMRGQKGSEYDGGHRVPCFIHWPAGNMRHGRNIDRLTAHIDILPTLIDLCGLKRPAEAQFDGETLDPLLRVPAVRWPDRLVLVESQRILHPEKWRQCAMMTDRWRLVNGKELYDMQVDPAQQHDVAERNSEIAARLRDGYEALWPGICHRDGDFARPLIGSETQEVTWLTSDHWIPTQGDVPWSQESIRRAPEWQGYWTVGIARDGAYEFSVRRWPEEVNRPITAPLPAGDTFDVYGPDDEPARMSAGKAISADKVRLKVADEDQTKPVPPGATEVRFDLRLKKGNTTAQAWFMRADGTPSCCAFYVYSRLLRAI